MTMIITTVVAAFVLAFVLGILLGCFKKVFFVPVDEKVEAIRACLPGANCGGCGYPGCDGFAAACARGAAPADGCVAGGPSVASSIGKVLGVEVSSRPKVAVLACQGSKAHTAPRGFYGGFKSCTSANLAVNGTKMCTFGCVGFGDCVAACKFSAISMGEDGLPHIDYAKCTGCGACIKSCPKTLLAFAPKDLKGAVALCSNHGAMSPNLKKNCEVACIKCKKCERGCTQHAIQVVNGIPVVDYSLCNSCNTCIEGCPTHVLKLVQDIITVGA